MRNISGFYDKSQVLDFTRTYRLLKILEVFEVEFVLDNIRIEDEINPDILSKLYLRIQEVALFQN